MSAVDVSGFLDSLEAREPSLKVARSVAEPKLKEIYNLLQAHGLGFGYRVIEEYVRYHAFDAQYISSAPHEVTDQLLVQKIMVKLRGTERQRSLLNSLDKACEGFTKTQLFVRRLINDLDEFGSFQAMR